MVLVAGGFGNNSFFSSTEIYDPKTGEWNITGDLATPRREHTSTLLSSGKVLIVGGGSYGSILPSAEIYDPSARTWSDAGNLATAQFGHTATLLPSGKVLVVGVGAEIYDPNEEKWAPAKNPVTPRYRHTATLLPSGKVLVAGGHSDGIFWSSAEIYDPSTDTWQDAGDMATPRHAHTATLLPSGKVLVVGGSDSPSAEIYDPDAKTWSDAENLAMSRYSHTATLLACGKVLVVGGHIDSNFSSAEIYDPDADTWSDAENLTTRRYAHTATLLPSGKVLIVGGWNGSYLSSTEVYDPSTETWNEAETHAVLRHSHTSTLLASGKVLIVAGRYGSSLSSVEVFDPGAGTWSDAEDIVSPRYSHTSTLLPSGEVLVAGGKDEGVLSSAEIFNPNMGWRDTEDLAAPRDLHTSTLLPSGEVLVVGGRDGLPLSSAEIFNPNTETWSDAGNLATPRHWHTATLLPSGKVLIAGGGNFLSSAEICDPSVGTWTDTDDLATPRSGHTSTLLPSGKVLVVGGYNGISLSSAEIYDPSAGTWTDTGNLNTPRDSHTATLLPSGKVLVVGGYNIAIGKLSSAEIYDPSVGTWNDAGGLISARRLHTSTLLPSGKVLVVGDSPSLSTEIYEVSTPPESRRPTIQSTSQNLLYGETFAITGLFQGDSEASGGNAKNSAVNYPILHLRSWDGTEHHTLMPDPQPNFWDTPRTLTVSSLPPTIHPGPHLLTVIVAGVPSEPVAVDMKCSLAITTHPTDQIAFPGETATFTVESQGGRLFQWQKEGIDIDEANDPTGPTYTTPPVTEGEDGTQYSVFINNGCTSEESEAAKLIIGDVTPPEAEVTHPSGGEYWLFNDPDAEDPNTEIIAWSMSDNVRICTVEVELIYSNDSGATWSVANDLGTFGDAETCPGVQTTSLDYEVPPSPPSGAQGSLYKIRIRVSDRFNTTPAASANPFFMTQRGDARALILTNSLRMDITPDLNESLQNLADHPTVLGFVVDLADVTSINNLYNAWGATTTAAANSAAANDVLFAPEGIHDYILNLLDVYPEVEHLIVVGGDRVIPMTRLEDRTFRLLESKYEYADTLPANTVSQALANNNYLSDDPLATTHS